MRSILVSDDKISSERVFNPHQRSHVDTLKYGFIFKVVDFLNPFIYLGCVIVLYSLHSVFFSSPPFISYVQIERTLGKNLMKMRDTTADELYSQLSANKMLVRLI
jgi:hypothetical protein